MSRKQLKVSITTLIVLLLLFNSPFLPGPGFLDRPAQLLYTVGQALGLIGLMGVPCGVIWFLYKKSKQQNTYIPVIFTIIFLVPAMSLLFISDILRNYSRNMAIKNGNKLVRQIEAYHSANNNYPDRLDRSVFDMPDSWVIGVDSYHYTKTGDNFELTFNQNVLLGFNFEIVTYNNRNEQKARGESQTLYSTADPNWKYEIFD